MSRPNRFTAIVARLRQVGLLALALWFARALARSWWRLSTAKRNKSFPISLVSLKTHGVLGVNDVREIMATMPGQTHVVFAAQVEDRYNFVRELGRGGFGVVHLAERKDQQDAAQVSVKTYPSVPMSMRAKGEALFRGFNLNGIGSGLCHPNVVRIIEFVVDELRSLDGLRIATVLEYLSGPDLFDWFEERQAAADKGESTWFCEQEIVDIGQQILRGLAYIHTHKPYLVHRDVKPENLKWGSRHPDAQLKLIDFGFVYVDGIEDAMRGKVIGTRVYGPPEMLQKKVAHPPPPSLDMYSFGVVLYLLLSGDFPHDGSAESASTAWQPPKTDAPVWATVSPSTVDLIKKLLAERPQSRPSATEILASQWVAPDTAPLPSPSGRVSSVRLASSKSRIGEKQASCH